MRLRFAVVFFLLLSSAGFAQSKHPFTFEDMMALKRVAEPVPSPDGKWVVFAAQDVDLEANKKTPHIWIVPLAGGDAKKISDDPAGEDRPRFSPDGKRLIYTSAKDGNSQIWVADFDAESGTLSGAHRLTSISTEADGAVWSPDGKNILFVSSVYPDCPDDACNKQRDDERAKSKVQAKIFTRLFYRHWNSYTSFKRSHLFIIAADGGTPHDITPGDHEVPPFNLGGQDMYAISPDGQEVAYTSNHDEVEAASTNNDIFIVPITGGEAKKISTSPGSDDTPLYSPDGKYIAWRMQKRAGFESDKFNLVIYDRKSGEIKNLTENFDLWVGSFVWALDSKMIYFTSEQAGQSPIFEVNVAAGNGPFVAIVAGHNDDLTITADGKTLLFTRMSVKAPNEIYGVNIADTRALKVIAGTEEELLKPGMGKQLTHLNDSVLSQISMQPLEPFMFTGAGKTQVEGFILKPPGFDPSKKYPVKFIIHGGPQTMWGNWWSYRWNFELFAASGYVVVLINPRGSTGYGQKFVDEISGDWGGKPYQDLMLGLDYAERTYPFIDKNRECALGASYGGYMVNWIMGHTNRFKCIVSHDGMFNTESAYGSTEELWFNEWEFKGMPWTNRALYRKWSPHLFAANFKTPTLVIHSQKDYRLDVSEGFQLFTTLQRLKVPSKMLYFPDEGHWVLKPQNSRLWYQTVNGWVDQYLK
ncbi:MAG TPA: S9 family peptidase [Terriglobales bacterium]|jgi:dipeptidyl aminopeptidase/acylaminoacyl peptidase|nr:S9 family peptidase [Terriglobales bacterium]